MRKSSLFSKDRLVYWPAEFADVVDLLNGRDREGRAVANGLYSLNTGPIVLAAALGLREGRKRDVNTKDRKEIDTSVFAKEGLDGFIFLVSLLGNPEQGIDILRPENEEQVIREFERYAAGGLELLAGELESSPTKSPDLLVQSLMLPRAPRVPAGGELPELI